MIEKLVINALLGCLDTDKLLKDIGRTIITDHPEIFLQIIRPEGANFLKHNIVVDNDTYDAVEACYRDDRRISGIKALRSASGQGLKECKESADFEFGHLRPIHCDPYD